jgi:hypothetical protein
LWFAPSTSTSRARAAVATARLCAGGTIESAVPSTTTIGTSTADTSSATGNLSSNNNFTGSHG